jgi:hypothetical protein
VGGVGFEGLADLERELAGRGEHEGLRLLVLASSRCRIGSAKAAVLPVPVWASPTTSRPASSAGMVSAWIGEGFS